MSVPRLRLLVRKQSTPKTNLTPVRTKPIKRRGTHRSRVPTMRSGPRRLQTFVQSGHADKFNHKHKHSHTHTLGRRMISRFTSVRPGARKDAYCMFAYASAPLSHFKDKVAHSLCACASVCFQATSNTNKHAREIVQLYTGCVFVFRSPTQLAFISSHPRGELLLLLLLLSLLLPQLQLRLYHIGRINTPDAGGLIQPHTHTQAPELSLAHR